MVKLYSDVELAQRLHLRKVFDDVDGHALVQLSTGKKLLAGLEQDLRSSIYSIPLRPSNTNSDPIMEFGPVHDPELMGGQFDNQSGMLLWCSIPNGQPFADLAHQCGYQDAHCRGAEVGALIDLGCTINNDDVILLSMKMVRTLLCAFEITAQDTAFIEQGSMRTNNEILPGTTSPRSTTL